MNKLRLLFLLLIISTFGCDLKFPQIANDPPSSAFGFTFQGRLERLEDVFYSSNLIYKERDFARHLQSSPEYEFVIVRSDTTINYVVILGDCQSIYSLVKWNDNWNCDSSRIIIREFTSNIDSLPSSAAKSIFKKEIIDHLTERLNSMTNSYRWTIEKKQDTVLVRILNQKGSLRKLYIYSFDSVGNDLAEKEIINYLGDSIIHYKKNQSQMFVYLESKKVIKNKNNSR